MLRETYKRNSDGILFETVNCKIVVVVWHFPHSSSEEVEFLHFAKYIFELQNADACYSFDNTIVYYIGCMGVRRRQKQMFSVFM